MQVKFRNYEYYRDVDIYEGKVSISCGGRFRNWIQEELTSKGIMFEIY